MRWLVALCLLAGVAHAQSFHATSPGPLANSHDNVACDDCHVNSTPVLSNALCARCHQTLVQRGLHTRASVVGKQCASCHGEHKGQTFDIQGWRSMKGGMQAFDHVLAGWKLDGAHAKTACVRCHTATMASGRTRFVGLSTTCGSAGCHQANPHRFAGPEFLRCDRCHTEAVWKPVKAEVEFDHDRDTKLPLTGAHRDAPCSACHPKTEFAVAKAECASCHASPKHASPRFDGRPCEPCHSAAQKTWKPTTFDHDERTKFPLDAGHRIACARCHTVKLGQAMPSANCEACHPGKTPHGKRFDKVQGGCASCHNGVKWASATVFSHGKQTKFPLVGKHGTIACRGCHRPTGPGNFENIPTADCKGCHAHTTVHADEDHPQGKYTSKQCLQCHVNNMHEPPRPPALQMFHGPQSAFPLVKGHKAVPCVDCHADRNAKGKLTFSNLSMECGDNCHEDVAHQGALGSKCTQCHVSGVWAALKFEHVLYPLEGDHRVVACATCHVDKRFKGAPRRCADAACHGRDDVHAGALGTTCDRCHLANGDNRFSHLISAKFKLDGKHLAVACADCHPSKGFKPRPFNCAGCHPEPRVHFGKYGTFCERCHTTKGWR